MWSEIKENLSFVLVCTGIIVLLGFVAWLAERYLLRSRKVSAARKVAIIGVCAAAATVLHILRFPLTFLAPSFYEFDCSELPVMLCGFYLGPTAVVFCEGIKILLKLIMQGTTTGFIGDFANFFTGCSFVLPAVIIYHISKTRKNAIGGLIVGTLTLVAFGSAFNAFYLIPEFAKRFGGLDVILAAGTAINSGITSLSTFVLYAVAPLNLLKGVIISVLTLLLYKKVARPLFSK